MFYGGNNLNVFEKYVEISLTEKKIAFMLTCRTKSEYFTRPFPFG